MSGYSNSDYSIGGSEADAVPRNDSELLEIFGIKDARIASPRDLENDTRVVMRQLRAVNGTDTEKWVPVHNVNVDRTAPPNFTVQAWIEVADAPGEYMSVITLFRTHKGQLECFVPPHTTYYVGVGTITM